MVGKTLKSKINGALFFVEQETLEQNGKRYYTIRDIKSGKKVTQEKGWFEYGIMQNLEVVNE